MDKKIKESRTISAKRNANYEIRKEHVIYTDGSTEDRIMCYSFAGKPLGGIQETERLFKAQGTGPTVTPKKIKK
jgi:hypothetical protein